MSIITLQTEDGSQVTNATILDFNPAPKAVIWGTRFFLLHSKGDGDTRAVFRETFVPAVVTAGKD